MMRSYSFDQRLICGIKLLVPATPRTGVMNYIRIVAVEIRVTRIDPAEIGQKGNKASVSLVDAVAGTVDLRNLSPGEHVAGFCVVDQTWLIIIVGWPKAINEKSDRACRLAAECRPVELRSERRSLGLGVKQLVAGASTGLDHAAVRVDKHFDLNQSLSTVCLCIPRVPRFFGGDDLEI